MKKLFNLILLFLILFSFVCPVYSSENKNINNKEKDKLDIIFTPVGVAIGTVVAPYIFTMENYEDIINWSSENIVIPVIKGTDKTIDAVGKGLYYGGKYTVVPTYKSIEFVFDKTTDGFLWTLDKGYDYVVIPVAKWTIVPLAKGTAKSVVWTNDYIFIPVAKGTGKVLGSAYDITISGMHYTIVPLAKGTFQVIENGSEYAVKGIEKGFCWIFEPVYKGLKFTGYYTIKPVMYGGKVLSKNIYNSLDWTTDNIVFPLAHGIGKSTSTVAKPFVISAQWSAEKIGDGAEWSYHNIIIPVSDGVSSGVSAVVIPIKNSAQATNRGIKKVLRKGK